MTRAHLFWLLIFFLSGLTHLSAQPLTPEDAGSSIKFAIKNFGFITEGSFTGLSGTIQFEEADPLQTKFDVKLKAATIETGNKTRDRHLREVDYFDVEQYPTISIKSESITKGDQSGSYILHGKLTIKGISRSIQLPFTVIPKNSGHYFEGKFTLNRLDYKVGSSSISLADNATVFLEILAK